MIRNPNDEAESGLIPSEGGTTKLKAYEQDEARLRVEEGLLNDREREQGSDDEGEVYFRWMKRRELCAALRRYISRLPKVWSWGPSSKATT